MISTLTPEPNGPVSVRTDEHGRLRVGNTNVLLDLVVHSFRLGSTPETIVRQYPSLSLRDVYVAIAYYLDHRAEVDAYIERQEVEAETFRREFEAQQSPKLTTEVLRARLATHRHSK